MFNIKWILSTVIILVITNSTLAQTEYNTLYETKYKSKLETYAKNIKLLMEIEQIPGLAVSFVKGDFIWSKGFGKINIENEAEINAEALFLNESIQKFMIALAIIQLYENEKIDLTAKASKYVSDLTIPFTINEMLEILGENLFRDKQYEKIYLPEVYRNKYSANSRNKMDAILIHLINIIEEVSEQKPEQYLKENIWDPSLMFSTKIENKIKVFKHRVNAYKMHKGDIANTQDCNISENSKNLQIRTTVNDMIKLVYTFFTNRILKNNKYQSFFINNSNFGFSWPSYPVNGRFGIEINHKGQAEDNTKLFFLPQDTVAIAIACNQKDVNLDIYAERLFQLILDEKYNLKPHLNTYKDKLKFYYMDLIFNFGLSAYKIGYQPNLYTDINFNFFNDNIIKIENSEIRYESQFKDSKQKAIKLGSYMSLILEKNNYDLAKYHKHGAIIFFNDYLKIYQEKSDYPFKLKFDQNFESLLKEWLKDWKSTFNEYTSNLFIYPGENLQDAYEQLKKLYEGKKIYPDFSHDIAKAIEHYSILQKFRETQGLGVFGMEIFKNSPDVYHALGLSFSWFNDADVTYDLFRMAQEYVPPHYSQVDHYIAETKRFEKWGKTNEAIAMLQMALRANKNNPRIFSQIGDLYYNINQKTRAKRYYNKSIKFDPDSDHVLERLTILKNIN